MINTGGFFIVVINLNEKIFKMSSAGNSYVYVSGKKLSKEDIKTLSYKNLSDGVVFIYRRGKTYGFSIYNKDGSKARFCGNAAMCVAKYLCDSRLVLSREFCILTGSGRKKVYKTGSGKKQKVRLEVGYPHFLQLNGKHVLQNRKPLLLNLHGKKIKLICSYIFVGNKHLVIFGEYDDNEKQEIVNEISKSNAFKGGVNVEFVRIIKNKIYADVYERGSGKTLSCGSGAAACFFAALKSGFKCNKADVVFEGGAITVLRINGKVYIQSTPVYENLLYKE